MSIDLSALTIRKAHEALKKGEFTAVELASAYLEMISKKNKDLNAYLEVYSDVKEQAERADKIIKEGRATLLTGIPIAVKDNILVEGRKASAASKMLENYTATYDATAIRKLKEQGVVFLGRTNMDEFAMGGSTENSAFGVTKNPHDGARVSGGSSGGSAAVVAMDGALIALGSDTGGSVRQPASFCGIVGLKPTYGAVSRHGLVAMGSSLDQIGPMAKTVEDVELIFNTIKGKDVMDSTTIDETTYPKTDSQSKKPTIGIATALIKLGGIDPDVVRNFNESVEKLKKLGFETKEIELPHVGYSLPVYYIVMPAEVSSNLARFDGVKYGLHKEGLNLLEDYLETRGEGFGKEVRRRILLGTYVLSSGYYDAFYGKANAAREVITKDFTDAFKSVDCILTPTSPTPAFKIGEKASDPLEMYLADVFTVTANLTGMPALSFPSGVSLKEGKELPLGLQLTAPHGREDILFAVAKAFKGEQ
jgi:aspartyl-tRNA(Asn)/glutamyl-tRNA(Gln) amidotransferase subunit A